MVSRRKTDASGPPKILVVDDDAKNRFAFRAVLEELECEVVEAESGNEALSLVTEQVFALILLDIQMPNMDGFEVANLIKSYKRAQDIPIIFVSAVSKTLDDIRHGHQIGAADYIVKPVDPTILASKVNLYLERFQMQKKLERKLTKLNTTKQNLSKDNAKLSTKASRDGLTGLHNRSSFENLIKEAIELARSADVSLAIMFMDLDDFKIVNDQHGHDAGDALLKAVSARIQDILRASDFFSDSDNPSSLARLGGDEFALVLCAIPRPEIANKIAERIVAAFKEPFIINKLELFVGISIGIATYPNAGKTPESLCKHADLAMYKAKKGGKLSYCLFTDEMEQTQLHQKILEDAVQGAIKNKDFSLVYQPIYDLVSKNIVGAELLCRWKHKTLGEILPDEFIPIAENAGLIVDLGHLIFELAIADIVLLSQSQQQTLWFAINVSIKQFYGNDFIDLLQSTLEKNALPSSAFEIEISETAFTEETMLYDKTINQLAASGVRISIDDFGTGNLSLNRLNTLSVSTLKIDQSIIEKIEHSKNDNNMLNTFLNLAKNMSLLVIAEGVETEKQLDFLKAHDCQYGQGFYFTEPLSFSDFKAIL
jgi:diguanylate cyclase